MMGNTSRLYFFVIVASIMWIVVKLLWHSEGGILSINDENDLKAIAIEFHGMVFDILLFGIILSLYDFFVGRNNEIKRLKESIDDFRHWNEKQATFRIVGNIKRLINKKVSKIDLSKCFLAEAHLENLNLRKAIIVDTNLKEAKLNGAILSNSYQEKVNFQGADFEKATLDKAKAIECD